MSEVQKWVLEPSRSWSEQRAIEKIDRHAARQAHIDRLAHGLALERQADAAQMAKFQVSVVYGLANHSIDHLAALDERRRALAGVDPEMNMLTMQIEMGAINAANAVIRKAVE